MKANKLIVVSAGTFGSPNILERSGIGAPSVLEKINIQVLVDLPGVGENFQGRFSILGVLVSVILQTTTIFVRCSMYPTRPKRWMMFGETQKQSPVSDLFNSVVRNYV